MNERELIASIANIESLLSKILDALQGGAVVSAFPAVPFCSYTLFSWLAEWLEKYHKINVSAETYKKDSGIIKNHICTKTEFDLPLHEFRNTHLQSLVYGIGFSRQRQIAANMLVSALRCAFDNEYIAKDVTKNFKKPVHETESDRALSRREERRFLNGIAGDSMELYIKVLLYAGLRRNEALGLQRKHIDFTNDNIYVVQQATMTGEITPKLKTKLSNRAVKLFPELKEALQPCKNFAADARLFDFLPDYATRRFDTLCRNCGIENFSVKSCRTTFATRCDEMGIPESIVSAWLGHSTIKTTKKHYQKINPDYVEREYKKAIKKGQK